MNKENGVGQRARRSTVNKLDVEDRPIHDWYRFVLSYPPHLVRKYVDRFGLDKGSRVLDPFCGTGTTIVECQKLGIPSIGFEASPMAHFASQVKVDWSPSPDGLLNHASQVAERTLKTLHKDGIEDLESLPLFSNDRKGKSNGVQSLRRLSADREKLILSKSICPVPLHKTLVLLETIKQIRGVAFYEHEILALAKALVGSIGNLHFGPEVGVTTPKRDCPVIGPWFAAVSQMAQDLHNVPRIPSHAARVIHGDARTLPGLGSEPLFDAVITSPPYPNEKDYTRTTRLESVILGFVDSRDALRTAKKGLLRSNTRGIYKGDDDDQWVGGHSKISKLAEKIENRRLELGKTSGFERMYHKVVRLYFGGMAKHLRELRKHLRPGAQLAYVVGDQASFLRVMIRTGRLLAEIAEDIGYQVVGIDLFRTRLATATREQLREEVVLLRWPGK